MRSFLREATWLVGVAGTLGCGGRSALDVVVPCFEPVADCNGDPFDGCEVDLASDGKHCGACGQRCPQGLVCGDSRCVAPETPVQVETNGTHLVRTASGRLFGWGVNHANLLPNVGEVLPSGDEIVTEVVALDAIPPLAEVHVTVGVACGRGFDGQVWCWGGTEPMFAGREPPAPFLVPGIANAVRLTAWHLGFCALEALGDWKCWGYETRHDDLAIGSGEPVSHPLAAPKTMHALPGFGRDVLTTVAVLADGSVWAWGDPDAAAMDVAKPNLPPVDPPARLDFVDDAEAVHAWDRVFCARRGAGQSIVCWGSLSGSNVNPPSEVPEPFAAFPPGDYKDVEPNGSFTAALHRDGRLRFVDGSLPYWERADVASVGYRGFDLVVVTYDGRVLCSARGEHGNCASGELGPSEGYVEVALPLDASGRR